MQVGMPSTCCDKSINRPGPAGPSILLQNKTKQENKGNERWRRGKDQI